MKRKWSPSIKEEIRAQKCSYFSTKNGIYIECKNLSEYMDPILEKYPVDMCAMHNHMEKTGIPIKCWRCGDR